MQTFLTRNVQEAYYYGLNWIRSYGSPEPSRNGAVLVAPSPVMTVYQEPMERVILDAGRDANPFFHLMEAMWMLAGRKDVESISHYNANMRSYSDDGRTFNAAYGHRWRHHFGSNQIVKVIEQLRADPTTRRAVIQMWDGAHDGRGQSKDWPCNTAVFFRALQKIGGGYRLDMTITNRSNDVIWGAYGANAVHMSVLQEFVAALCGMEVGRMYQLSNNYHVYAEILEKVGTADVGVAYTYVENLKPTPLFLKRDGNLLTDEIDEIFEQIETWWTGFGRPNVEVPLYNFMHADAVQTLQFMRSAWWEYKNKNLTEALLLSREIPGPDWSRACTEWVQRRIAKKGA